MSPVVKFALILAVILVLVGGFVFILRRMTSGKLVSSGSQRNRSRQPRLGVIDVYDLDRTRQLVLLRRDNVEHLLLIGGPNDVVIETNIVRVTSGRSSTPADVQFDRPEHAIDSPTRLIPEPPLRPVVEPPSQRHVMGERETGQHAFAPRHSEPEGQIGVLPSQQTTIANISIAAVAAATQYDPTSSVAIEADVPNFLRGHNSPTPAAEEQITIAPPFSVEAQTQTTTADFPEFTSSRYEAPASYLAPAQEPVETATAMYEPEPMVFSGSSPSPQPQTNQKFTPIPEVSRPETAFPFAPVETTSDQERYVLQPETDKVQFQSLEIGTETAPHESDEAVSEPIETAQHGIQLDQAAFSDMARQLEEVLKNAHPQQIDPMEMAATVGPTEILPFAQEASVPQPESIAESHALHQSETMEPDVTLASALLADNWEVPAQEADRVEAQPPKAPIEAEISATPVPEVEMAAPQTEPSTRPKPVKPADDPFSLDDIEAEFARLLGRTDDKSGPV